jgi:molecular chaperone DnaK
MSMSSARVFPASLAARAPVASGLRRGDRRARGVARARPPTAPRVYASICGIDLGTTNSCVAVVIDGRPVLVPDEKGRRTIPSVVHFAPDGSVTVGHAAAKRLTRDPANTFHSVKRFIGKRFKDKKVAEDARRVPYEVCATVEADAEAMGLVGLGPSKNGAGFVAVRCPALGRKVSPEEISAAIVKRCVALASAKLGGDKITKAVITVPAYFDDGQCDATIRAGLRAGLETVKLLREPIAAALAYGVDVTGDETVFVFDLGGGTFDVSVLDVGGGAVEVLATGGDAHLGGDDLDRAVAVWLAKEAKLMGATVDPRGALQAARRAREKLSDATEVVVPMPGGSTKTLTRPLLEKVCSEILRDLRLPVENAADSAGINLEALQAESRSKKSSKKSRKTGRPFDHVLLVGGATKTPAVRRFVENTFGRRPTPGLVDPDEVVALGAAAHAGALEGLVAQTETLGPMQASLIRAFARKMRNEDESLFERVRDDAEGVERGGAFDASGMAATAAAAGMDLVEEDDDDWGPEDLSELEGLTDEEIEALIAEMGDEEDEDEDEDERA